MESLDVDNIQPIEEDNLVHGLYIRQGLNLLKQAEVSRCAELSLEERKRRGQLHPVSVSTEYYPPSVENPQKYKKTSPAISSPHLSRALHRDQPTLLDRGLLITPREVQVESTDILKSVPTNLWRNPPKLYYSKTLVNSLDEEYTNPTPIMEDETTHLTLGVEDSAVGVEPVSAEGNGIDNLSIPELSEGVQLMELPSPPRGPQCGTCSNNPCACQHGQDLGKVVSHGPLPETGTDGSLISSPPVPNLEGTGAKRKWTSSADFHTLTHTPNVGPDSDHRLLADAPTLPENVDPTPVHGLVLDQVPDNLLRQPSDPQPSAPAPDVEPVQPGDQEDVIIQVLEQVSRQFNDVLINALNNFSTGVLGVFTKSSNDVGQAIAELTSAVTKMQETHEQLANSVSNLTETVRTHTTEIRRLSDFLQPSRTDIMTKPQSSQPTVQRAADYHTQQTVSPNERYLIAVTLSAEHAPYMTLELQNWGVQALKKVWSSIKPPYRVLTPSLTAFLLYGNNPMGFLAKILGTDIKVLGRLPTLPSKPQTFPERTLRELDDALYRYLAKQAQTRAPPKQDSQGGLVMSPISSAGVVASHGSTLMTQQAPTGQPTVSFATTSALSQATGATRNVQMTAPPGQVGQPSAQKPRARQYTALTISPTRLFQPPNQDSHNDY